MARKTETTTEQVTRERVVEIACDICGRTLTGKYAQRHPPNWHGASDSISDNLAEVTVQARRGFESQYDVGGDVVITRFDICPDCFEGRVVPALRAMGAEPSVEEVDW